MEISAYFVLVILCLICVYIWKKRGYAAYKLEGKPLPEPPALPLLGHSFSSSMENFHFKCAEYAENCGKVFQLRMFGNKIVVINDHNLLRKAFASEEYGDAFSDRPENFTGKFLYKGVEQMSSSFTEKNMIERKMFHKGLKVFGDGAARFEKHVRDELTRLVAEIETRNGDDVDLIQLVKESFGYWMSSLLTGYPAEEGDSRIIWEWAEWADTIWSPHVNIVLESFPFLRHLPGKYGNICKSTLHARDKFHERFASNLDDLADESLIKLLYNMQTEENTKAGYEIINDFEMLAIIQDAAFVGVTTTCAALINGLALLLRHQECAAKVQKEIDDVVGQSRAPTLNDRRNMPYTKATILEIFRITSQNPLPIPRSAAWDTVLEGFYVQKGSTVFYNSWFIQHDPRIWRDPWTFRPERFLESAGRLLPPEHELRQAVVTFSFGRRSCPGATLAKTRLFLYITRILQEFDLRPASTNKLPNTDPRFYKPGLDLRVEDFLCRAIPR